MAYPWALGPWQSERDHLRRQIAWAPTRSTTLHLQQTQVSYSISSARNPEGCTLKWKTKKKLSIQGQTLLTTFFFTFRWFRNFFFFSSSSVVLRHFEAKAKIQITLGRNLPKKPFHSSRAKRCLSVHPSAIHQNAPNSKNSFYNWIFISTILWFEDMSL